MPVDPFKEFQNIPTIDNLLETAFNRANKKASGVKQTRNPIQRVKNKETRRIHVAFDYVMEYLVKIVTSVPDLSKLHPFYFNLSQVLVNNDELKQKLGRISGVIKVLDRIRREQNRSVSRFSSSKDIKEARKQAFGRMKSVLDKLKTDFEYLKDARAKLKSLPVFFPDRPTVVIAGYPNVGKSSCINTLCGTNIETAHYPFTTKEVKVGQFEEGLDFIQLIDTPGILDRPMQNRNDIELQAIIAIKYIANVILFIIDPTITCGYRLDEQLELLKEVKSNFTSTPLIIIVNKEDIISYEERKKVTGALEDLDEHDFIFYSAIKNEKQDEIILKIKTKLSRS